MAKKEYPAHLLEFIEVSTKGVIYLFYKGDKEPLTLTPGQVSDYPLARIPLFNILRSDSKWKKVVKEWFNTCLGWRVEFKEKGDIDPVKEEEMWRKALRVGRLNTNYKLSLGTKGKVVNE